MGGKITFPSSLGEGGLSFLIDKASPRARENLDRFRRLIQSERELTMVSLNSYRSGSQSIIELELVGKPDRPGSPGGSGDDFRVFYKMERNSFLLS